MNKLNRLTKTLLMGPGPSSVSPNVYKALSTHTIGHLDPRFIDIMDSIKLLLKNIFNTRNDFCMPVSGTGSAAMESCFVNLVSQNDKVLIVQNGYFGLRMENMCQRLGANIDLLKFDWGKEVDVSKVEEKIKCNNYDVVAVVHAETSTGVRNDIESLSKVIKGDSIFIVDAVTSLGTIELNIDEWRIDAVYSCSQKGLSCPPGASPVCFSERAIYKMKGRDSLIPNWYLDMKEIIKYWDGNHRTYHHTAPINMMYALYQSLLDIENEGLDNVLNRHLNVHNKLVRGLEELDLKMLVNEQSRLYSLNAVKIPDGVDDVHIRSKLLNDYDIEIGGGLGPFAGKLWRIGLMGYSANEENVNKLLKALNHLL